MKQISVVIAFLWVFAAFPIQGQTASKVFVSSPDPALLVLSTTDRLDLIDLYEAGQKAVVRNGLNDSCSIVRLTDNYLHLLNGKSEMELILLSLINDSKIICLIRTVCSPVCDSSPEFYTTEWKKLDSKLFITPVEKEWFIKEGIDANEQKVRNILIPLDISLMQFRYDPERNELSQYYNTPYYLNDEDRAKAEPYLKQTPRIFKWNQMRFE